MADKVSFHSLSLAVFDEKRTAAQLLPGGLYFVKTSDKELLLRATSTTEYVDLTGSAVKSVTINGDSLKVIYMSGAEEPVASRPRIGSALLGYAPTHVGTMRDLTPTDSITGALGILQKRIQNAESSMTTMIDFKGTIGSSSSGATVTSLPNDAKKGDAYRVITAGTYAGQICEVGDLIICINKTSTSAVWTVLQTNIDTSTLMLKSGGRFVGQVEVGSSTNANLVLKTSGDMTLAGGIMPIIPSGETAGGNIGSTDTPFNEIVARTISAELIEGTATLAQALETARTIALSNDVTGSGTFDGSDNLTITATLKNSGVTAGSYGAATGDTSALSHSGTFKVPIITVDAKGRITSASTKTFTLPSSGNTDTKVKQTSNNSNVNYPVLFATTGTPTSGTAYESYYYTNLKFNPSTGNLQATKFNTYVLAAACAKGVTSSVTSGGEDLVTSGGVYTALEWKTS